MTMGSAVSSRVQLIHIAGLTEMICVRLRHLRCTVLSGIRLHPMRSLQIAYVYHQIVCDCQ